MLIQALCEYHDILAQSGKLVPDGYSPVPIHYCVSLRMDGSIAGIYSCETTEIVTDKKGKQKEKQVPTEITLPKRTQKTGVDANIAEHRPLYLFGLQYDKDKLSAQDRTQKAKKSHIAYVEKNLTFLEGLESPMISAYRAFLTSWKPEDEVENPFLLELGKKYSTSSYIFSLEGHPEIMLHTEPALLTKWDSLYHSSQEDTQDILKMQCAVIGEEAPIARIHEKIKGVMGGLATGTVLISYKNSAETSYGKEQSYNSNISETVMQKYTSTLNYLLKAKNHHIFLEGMTLVFWSMTAKSAEDDIMSALFQTNYNQTDTNQTGDMLLKLMKQTQKGAILSEQIASTYHIDPNVDFYIVGLFPNTSRLSLKFLYHKKYGEILQHIAEHQNDLQIGKELHPVSIGQIFYTLLPPSTKNVTVPPALTAKIMESVLYGTPYPISLLSHMIKRVKTDTGLSVSRVRAGVIRGCINRYARRNQKEELQMCLDEQNTNQAYVCGRLFAVLEKLQKDALGNGINRTIKDAYFASAASKPSLVFPKILKLAQHHLNKVNSPVYYNKCIGEIIALLDGKFPDTLSLMEQGKFIIGYYQQYESFFEKKEKSEAKDCVEETEA